MNIAWTIGKKIKIKRYKMNKCFAPAVFHLSCHLGSDYANLLPFCSRSFFFFSCFSSAVYFCVSPSSSFVFYFMRKRFMFQRIWSLWSALVCHAQLTLLFWCSFFVASRIIECLIVNGMYVIDILFHSDGGKGGENDKMKLTNVKKTVRFHAAL